MAISWIPKSTVPATLAGIMYTEAKTKDGYEEYVHYGITIQTTTILAIICCEPIGAFLIDTFGPRLLTKS
jgi:hypothetical protein